MSALSSYQYKWASLRILLSCSVTLKIVESLREEKKNEARNDDKVFNSTSKAWKSRIHQMVRNKIKIEFEIPVSIEFQTFFFISYVTRNILLCFVHHISIFRHKNDILIVYSATIAMADTVPQDNLISKPFNKHSKWMMDISFNLLTVKVLHWKLSDANVWRYGQRNACEQTR